jgi:hypothetical protein
MLRGASLRVTGPRVAVLRAVHDHPHADTNSISGAAREDLDVVMSLQAACDVLRALTDAGTAPPRRCPEDRSGPPSAISQPIGTGAQISGTARSFTRSLCDAQ